MGFVADTHGTARLLDQINTNARCQTLLPSMVAPRITVHWVYHEEDVRLTTDSLRRGTRAQQSERYTAGLVDENSMDYPEVIASWRQLEELHKALLAEPGRCPVYRGQRDFGWELATTLERAARRFGLSSDRLPAVETWLITEFQRHSHRFATVLPEQADRMRWLTLMQHHGAPTRLLDWMYSFFVAVHFAIERRVVVKSAVDC